MYGGVHIYYSVNVTSQITAKSYIGSLVGYSVGNYYVYSYAYNCYYNGNIVAHSSKQFSNSDPETFTDEIDKDKMLEKLNTDLEQVEWDGNTVDVWKIVSGKNDGYPVLYWE